MAEAAPSLSMLAGTSCTIDFTVPEGLVLAGEDGIFKGKPGFAVLFDEADGNVLRRVGVLSRFEVMLSRMRQPSPDRRMRTPSRMSGSSSTIMMVCIVYDSFPVLHSIRIADFLHCGQRITYFLGFVG